MQAYPLFSSPLITLHLQENLSELKKDVEYNSNQNASNAYSSKDKNILEKYPKTRKTLLNEFEKIAHESFYYKNNFKITTSWITKIDPGGYAQLHSHKNSFYSGVYYFDEYTPQSSPIEFETPLRSHWDFYIIPREFSIMNSFSWKVPPEKNLLIFFPSYLQHRVLTNQESKSRYSLAFNIVPVGECGEGDSTFNYK